jgi:hypothetical protein
MRLFQPGAQKAEVIVEAVLVSGGRLLRAFGAVAKSLKSNAVAVLVANSFELRPGLASAGVEGGIDVDEVCGLCWQGRQDGEIFAVKNTVHGCATPDKVQRENKVKASVCTGPSHRSTISVLINAKILSLRHALALRVGGAMANVMRLARVACDNPRHLRNGK